MADTKYLYDQMLLEKRSTDLDLAVVPEEAVALYNKGGSVYALYGDTGFISEVGAGNIPLEFVSSGSVANGTATWNITLPTDFQWLDLLLKLAGDTTTTRALRLQIGGDTASNYQYQYHRWTAGANTIVGATAAAHMQFYQLCQRNNQIPYHTLARLRIVNNADPDEYTQILWEGTNELGMGFGHGLYKVKSQDTTLNLFPTSGNFGDSEYWMWGYREAGGAA